MSSALFTQTLKDKATGTVIVAALLFVFMVYICFMFSQLKQMTGVEEMLNNPAIQAMLGKSASIATFEGFLTLFSFSYMGLIIGGFIAFMAASFLAGEIEQKTIDLLLSLPLRRGHLVLWRYAVLVPLVALLMLTLFVAIYIGTAIAGLSTSLVWVAYALAYVGLFALAFGAISMLISALLSDGRQAALLSIGVLFVMYFAETIGSTVASMDIITKLSLFHYVNSSDILVGHTLNLVNVVVLIGVLVVFLVLAVLAYRRKEINVT